MTVSIEISLSPESLAVIERWHGAPERAQRAIGRALKQGLEETAAHLQATYLRGGDPRVGRKGKAPLAVRSGALLGSVTSKLETDFTGFVGAGFGGAVRYAGVLLGKGTTTIVPKKSKHLWIPVADNLTRSGVARLSPSAAMDLKTKRGKRALRIFRSKKGNLVAGVSSDAAKVPGVRRKGFRLLFVLKDKVDIEGTDALAMAVEDRRLRMRDLIQQGISAALSGGN